MSRFAGWKLEFRGRWVLLPGLFALLAYGAGGYTLSCHGEGTFAAGASVVTVLALATLRVFSAPEPAQ